MISVLSYEIAGQDLYSSSNTRYLIPEAVGRTGDASSGGRDEFCETKSSAT